jgi:hypothetical protein
MSSPQIERDDIGERVVAAVRHECRLDAGLDARTVAVAAVEDLVLVQHDRLAHPVRADVLDQGGKFVALDQRKEFREWVEWQRRLRSDGAGFIFRAVPARRRNA